MFAAGGQICMEGIFDRCRTRCEILLKATHFSGRLKQANPRDLGFL
jgi:hypothetical protein